MIKMEVLKNVVPNHVVLSSQQIQTKVIEIVKNIHIGQVHLASIDDEKWMLIIEKTRVISESAVFGFMKEKHQQIYTEFLIKVNASVKQYRVTANKEYEKYFERKDDHHEEDSNSAKLFSLTQKASKILLESDA
jgi:hypothetical protein